MRTRISSGIISSESASEASYRPQKLCVRIIPLRVWPDPRRGSPFLCRRQSPRKLEHPPKPEYQNITNGRESNAASIGRLRKFGRDLAESTQGKDEHSGSTSQGPLNEHGISRYSTYLQNFAKTFKCQDISRYSTHRFRCRLNKVLGTSEIPAT